MNDCSRGQLARWKVRLWGSTADRAAWLAAARREGHRVYQGEDESEFILFLTSPAQVREVCSLLHVTGVNGVLAPLS
jgi:hypothetical protein